MDGVAEVLRQIRDGRDFSPPASILRASPKAAVLRLPGWPYSLADNVAHAAYWQELWLARLRGGGEPWGEDWPTVPAGQWSMVRERFLSGLEEAIQLAEVGDPRGAAREDRPP